MYEWCVFHSPWRRQLECSWSACCWWPPIRGAWRGTTPWPHPMHPTIVPTVRSTTAVLSSSGMYPSSSGIDVRVCLVNAQCWRITHLALVVQVHWDHREWPSSNGVPGYLFACHTLKLGIHRDYRETPIRRHAAHACIYGLLSGHAIHLCAKLRCAISGGYLSMRLSYSYTFIANALSLSLSLSFCVCLGSNQSWASFLFLNCVTSRHLCYFTTTICWYSAVRKTW